MVETCPHLITVCSIHLVLFLFFFICFFVCFVIYVLSLSSPFPNGGGLPVTEATALRPFLRRRAEDRALWKGVWCTGVSQDSE